MSVVRLHAAVFNAGDIPRYEDCFGDVSAMLLRQTIFLHIKRFFLYMALNMQTAYDFH